MLVPLHLAPRQSQAPLPKMALVLHVPGAQETHLRTLAANRPRQWELCALRPEPLAHDRRFDVGFLTTD